MPTVVSLHLHMNTHHYSLSGYKIEDLTRGVLMPIRTSKTEKRYTTQDETTDLIDAKHAILHVLSFVKSIRGQFRLTKFLAYFAEVRKKGFESTVSAAQIANIIEILTDSRLNLETLSGVDFTDTIFVDLLMYEDEEVFEEVLTVLIEEHEPTKALLHNCNHVHFLTNDTLDAPMLSYDSLKSDIWELQHLFSSVEEWCGLRNELVPARFVRCLNILIRIRQFLFSGLVGDHIAFKEKSATKQLKEFLFSLNMHGILFESLEWDLGDGAVGDDNFSWVEVQEQDVSSFDLSTLVTRSLILLGDLVCDKSRAAFGEILTVEYIALKNKRKPLRKYLYGLLYETFQGSEKQVERTPEEVIFIFASLLKEAKLKHLAMQFFEEQLCPGAYESVPVYRNQDVVAHAIMENIRSFSVNTTEIGDTIETYVSCMNLIAECCRDNPQNRNLLQFLFPTKTLMERIDGVVHYVLSVPFKPSHLRLHAVLLDAYVDAFNVICMEEASHSDLFISNMRYYVALLHKEMKDTSRDNVVMLFDPLLKLLRAHCAAQAEMGGDSFCLSGLRHICHRILARPPVAANAAGSVWSTSRLLAMEILGLSGEGKSYLEKKAPSLLGPQRCLDSPLARKRLVALYDTSDVSGFVKSRIKISSSNGAPESQKNFFVPALLHAPPARSREEDAELIQQYKTSLDDFETKVKSETTVNDPAEFEDVSEMTLLGSNPLAGGLNFASKAGSGLLSATSKAARRVSTVGGGVELGSSTGRRQKSSSNAAQDMYLQLELRNFVKRVSQHKNIKGMLVAEKQYVLNLLVHADDLTDPNAEEHIQQLQANSTVKKEGDAEETGKAAATSSKKGSISGGSSKTQAEVRTNVVTWQEIVVRMIKHVDFKNNTGATNGTVCRHILYLLELYVRAGDGGGTRTAWRRGRTSSTTGEWSSSATA